MKDFFLLDTNVFIEAKNRYYGFDFCPGFWEWLITQNTAGKVVSIDKVKGELLKKEDELSAWAKNLDESFFLKSDHPDMISSLKEVSEWIKDKGYSFKEAEIFRRSADFYLVAYVVANRRYALVDRYTIVTEEKREDKNKKSKKVKIPDVCDGLGIRVIDTFEMLREMEVIFILG